MGCQRKRKSLHLFNFCIFTHKIKVRPEQFLNPGCIGITGGTLSCPLVSALDSIRIQLVGSRAWALFFFLRTPKVNVNGPEMISKVVPAKILYE